MKTMAEMLLEEKKRSDEFSRLNFGLQFGDDFPAMARELLADSEIAQALLGIWLIGQLTGSNVAKSLAGSRPNDARELLRNNPDITKTPFEFLYYGIQIGRRLEREQAETLSAIAKGINE